MLMQTLKGQMRCIMGHVEVLKARRPWGRGWRMCWFSVEKRKKGGWITQNEYCVDILPPLKVDYC